MTREPSYDVYNVDKQTVVATCETDEWARIIADTLATHIGDGYEVWERGDRYRIVKSWFADPARPAPFGDPAKFADPLESA